MTMCISFVLDIWIFGRRFILYNQIDKDILFSLHTRNYSFNVVNDIIYIFSYEYKTVMITL